MKKILFLYILLLCCACEEDKSYDPTIMPPITTTGENTLGCLIDGWIYTSGRFGNPEISTYKEDGNNYIRIESQVGLFTTLNFTLVNPTQGATCSYINTTFDGGTIDGGEARITRMDGKIISGTFSGGEISEGRFDVRYQNNEDNN